jgi:hypothetical protein
LLTSHRFLTPFCCWLPLLLASLVLLASLRYWYPLSLVLLASQLLLGSHYSWSPWFC